MRDLKFPFRNLARQRTFAATSLLTLALGVGVTTAIFSVISGVVLRPLPFTQPDRLVQLYGTPASRGEAVDHLSDFRNQSKSFDTLVGYSISARYFRGKSEPERVMTVSAEPNLFSMLGSQPLEGRTFRAGDPPNVAVVSEAFWKQHSDARIGDVLSLDDERFTIIGVMPDAFQFPYGGASLLSGEAPQARTDLWWPLDPPRDPALRASMRFSNVTGRLKPNVSLSAAEAEMAVIAQRLQSQNPDPYGARGVRLEALSDAVVSPRIRRLLFLLLAGSGIVLALACANVANLSLVRTAIRSGDIAIRTAIGATRLDLVWQFLVESFVLLFAGGLLGVPLAVAGTRWMKLIAVTRIPRLYEVTVDWRTFAFLFGTCTLAALTIGLAPAWIAIRQNANVVLQGSNDRNTMTAGQSRFRDALVIAEVALAFVLAAGATLLLRELVRLHNTDPGMMTQNVITFHLGHRMTSRGRERPFDSDVRQFYEIAERIRQLPTVRAAGFTQVLPLQNWGWQATSNDFVRSRIASPVFSIELRYVTPGYFEALRIPVLRGRGFTAQDNRDAPGVILINEALARQYFANEDPIGKATARGLIVGVVGNVRQVNLDRAASPEIYYPVAQTWSQVGELGMSLVVGTRNTPDASVSAIRAIIRDVNPNLAIFNIKTMDRVVADSLADFTFYLSLIGLFAILALVLSLTGTYGVVSFIATSRTREFAIRVAVGADVRRVLQLILFKGFCLTVAGLVLGLFFTVAATPLLQNLPVSVRPPDASTIVPLFLFVTVVALGACLWPALRAARVDPMTTLRNE
jgi:predicted permease